jgi:enamine deaminase RidA (YjgF/YER057c/UK114 family)
VRHSIDVPGLGHRAQPIPCAARIGGFLATGGVRGVDPETGRIPEDVAAQAELMFANLRAIVEAGGLSCEDILKVTVWVAQPEAREHVNQQWVRMFPDERSRPARHTVARELPAGMLVQCEALAVRTGGDQ